MTEDLSVIQSIILDDGAEFEIGGTLRSHRVDVITMSLDAQRHPIWFTVSHMDGENLWKICQVRARDVIIVHYAIPEDVQ